MVVDIGTQRWNLLGCQKAYGYIVYGLFIYECCALVQMRLGCLIATWFAMSKEFKRMNHIVGWMIFPNAVYEVI